MAEAWTDGDGVLDVTVVVPVRNDRGGQLRALIEGLSRQSLPRGRFEVVVGDDGSSDGSTRDLATDDGWLRVAHGPPRSSYAARNRAAAAARPSRAFAFVDSDCVPEPDWLEQGLAALAAGADAAAGEIVFAPPERR